VLIGDSIFETVYLATRDGNLQGMFSNDIDQKARSLAEETLPDLP
jgi:hypothetical protein